MRSAIFNIDSDKVTSYVFLHENNQSGSIVFNAPIKIADDCNESKFCKPSLQKIKNITKLEVDDLSIDCDGIFDLNEIHSNRQGVTIRCGIRNKDAYDLSILVPELKTEANVIQRQMSEFLNASIYEETRKTWK